MQVDRDLAAFRIKAVARFGISDVRDGPAGDGGIVHPGAGRDLAHDLELVRNRRDLAGDLRLGVLGKDRV